MSIDFRTLMAELPPEQQEKVKAMAEKMRKQLTSMPPETPPLPHSLKCRKKSPHLG